MAKLLAFNKQKIIDGIQQELAKAFIAARRLGVSWEEIKRWGDEAVAEAKKSQKAKR
jgi:hypothetical protein